MPETDNSAYSGKRGRSYHQAVKAHSPVIAAEANEVGREFDGWRPRADLGDERDPATIIDCLCRYYDAGLNRFLIQRFTGVVVHEFRFIWSPPWQGAEQRIDIEANGYRVVRWKPAPELPDDLKELLPGPSDDFMSEADLQSALDAMGSQAE